MSQQISEQENIKDLTLENTLQPIENIIDDEVSNNQSEEPVIEEKVEVLENIEPVQQDIILKLGDIILISSPSNEILNNNVFLIEYINPTKIKIVNAETLEKTTLPISSDGIIGDGTIESLKVISSNPKNGYARQNELLPGTWINIYFGGDIPTVITGKITDLDEDMIELKTTDNDTIYINFNYEGIPENLPIETFEIRPPPESLKETEVPAEELVDIGEEEEDRELEEGEIAESFPKIPVKEVKEKIQRFLIDANDIEFGDVVLVEELVNIDKEKMRFNIEAQTNDLLEEMISNVPSAKRTNNVLNNIHIMITRFIQLRDLASTFDNYSNISGVIKKTADDRPLAEYLADFKNTLYWIMIVASNVKKIYPEDEQKTQFKRFGDYENIKESNDLLEIKQLFSNYRSNTTVEGQNKYSNLYYSLDPYMTPFYSIPVDAADDVFSSPNNIIIDGGVKTDINAIVNNLQELYSTVVAKSELTRRRFVLQRYNLGMDRLEATNLKGSKLIAHRVKLTNNDNISVNSILTLPEPAVRFSQINLPGTNMLVRANLNLNFLNYWQLLKQNTNSSTIIIDGLDNELEYDDSNFVDNIKQYMLDLSEYERPKELTNLDIYKIFLRTIIPKIRVLFLLVKKYIKGRLSLVDVVNFLEPFLIYPIDLTYMQYNEINSFIFEKIKEYNIKYKYFSGVFADLKNLKRKGYVENSYVYSNPLFDMFDSQMGSHVYDLYGVKPGSMSGSEFLKKMLVEDFGNLFNTAVSYTNISLMYPKELSSVFDMDKDKLKQMMEKDKSKDTCTSYIIAKKYYDTNKLVEDNGKTIYFDKEYDNTPYEIIQEKYKNQRDNLSPEDFILFLSEEFKNNQKMDENKAEYMAETLVNQAKKVRDGNYAILVNEYENIPEELVYYVRKDDQWEIAKEVDPNWFIKEDDVLCNINYNCMYNTASKDDEKCESTAVMKDTIMSNALKEVIDQFDKNYNISKEQLEELLKKNMIRYGNIFDKLKEIREKQFYKYNNEKYNIGLSILEEVEKKVVSPYAKLRDLIIGQTDFVKKQSDIIRFVNLYCRYGDPTVPNIHDGEMESEWWLYCKETNTKLLPMFRETLATAFLNGPEAYESTLNELIQYIGKQSDDGSAWVDEHSGEIICYVDFDVSEGYKDGFVSKSRDIIEKDAGEVLLEQQQDLKLKQNKKLTLEGQIVSNMITSLSSNMGINMESQRDFIIKIVTELMTNSKVLEKESTYKEREKEAAKKGKKMPEYSKVYSQTLLFLTLGTYLIGLQTSIPSIKTRKTVPGCVRSFSGFPLEGEGDTTGLDYLACVSLKHRDPTTMPWNQLPKDVEKISGTTKLFIIKYLLPYPEIDQRIKSKVEYLLTNPEQDIPEEHSLSNWVNFLPPLKRFHIKHLENVSDAFTDQLKDELISGNPRQLEKLLVVESKIISFSLAIQEKIQNLVEAKDLLLKGAGNPFMENACCNENGTENITTLQYFINDDPNISNYNTIVKQLSALMNDIEILTNSAMMLSEVNTKRIFSPISMDFSEETIYLAFITLCRFQSSLALSEELASVCIDKPDYLSISDSIQEKIAKLKRDGRNYTKESFLRLFQIVCRNNIIKMSISFNKPSCIDNLTTFFDEIDVDGDNKNIPKALTQKMEKILESYDVTLEQDIPEMRQLKNYLQSSIQSMRKEILDFIRLKSKISGIELTRVTRFLNNLMVWKYDESIRNSDIKISDDNLYNTINFVKNFISLFSVVFPTMIYNKKVQSIYPHKYWGLSRVHDNDIKEMVNSFYKPLDKFYGNIAINNVLLEIQNKTRGIYLLSNLTPAISSIKVGEKEIYSVFEKNLVLLLFEYYFLSVLTEYVVLSKDPSMITKMLKNPDNSDDLFSEDFLIEQQLRFADTEEEFIEGDVSKLKEDIAKLLVSYLSIMMNSKQTIDVSFDDVEDRVFKLKEAEKYTFTDRLKAMKEEERQVDTVLKHYKLGPLYSIGLSKGIKEYDPDNFDHDKKVAEKVAEIQRNLRNKGVGDRDMDMEVEDMLENIDLENDIERDIAMTTNQTDDYDDGDPWGEEMDNMNEYD